MMKKLLIILMVSLLLITACNRDMSKQINSEKAKEIAMAGVYEKTGNANLKISQTNEELNGDYWILLQNNEKEGCYYSVKIKYDGSKLKVKENCHS